MYNNNLTYKLYTRWADMDSFNHINNAKLFTYLEDARISLFERWNIKNIDKSIILASININYCNQLKHPEKIIIEQGITKIGNTSFDISSKITLSKHNTLIANAVATCVCFNYNINKAISVYSVIKDDYSS